MNTRWSLIHDFFLGWGYQEVLREPETVRSGEARGIPYRVCRGGECRMIYFYELHALGKSKLTTDPDDAELDAVYSLVESLRAGRPPELEFPETFRIPLVSPAMPDIREALKTEPFRSADVVSFDLKTDGHPQCQDQVCPRCQGRDFVQHRNYVHTDELIELVLWCKNCGALGTIEYDPPDSGKVVNVDWLYPALMESMK